LNDYVILTDSACDISTENLNNWGVEFTQLTLRFTNDNKECFDREIDIKEFYDRMRSGGIAKTAAANSQIFSEAFEKVLKTGKDVLYLGFSSGLSTTFNSARIAAQQLCGLYPDRKVIVVDTLAASAGFGLLVKLVVDKKNEGATIEEAAAYAEDIKLNICHWFTVDDLVYLKRGGRVSATAAFVGNVLGIKPVLHVDNDGHLINISKVRGRKTAVAALAQKYGELADTERCGKVFISHADCLSDVEELKNILKSKYGAEVELVCNVGPVIGSHSGPGTLALFFVGKER
jgi:DegV family protein with EDD domain